MVIAGMVVAEVMVWHFRYRVGRRGRNPMRDKDV